MIINFSNNTLSSRDKQNLFTKLVKKFATAMDSPVSEAKLTYILLSDLSAFSMFSEWLKKYHLVASSRWVITDGNALGDSVISAVHFEEDSNFTKLLLTLE